MSTFTKLSATLVAVLGLFSTFVAAQVTLREELKSLQPLIGTSWLGEFKNSTPEKPVGDEVRFEIILDGQAVRSVHTVTGGYSGETIFMWDPSTERVIFWYFTNSGMYSEGWIERVEGIEIHRALNFNGGDITAWQASVVINDDGSWRTEAQYFKNGAWVPGHAITYRPK